MRLRNCFTSFMIGTAACALLPGVAHAATGVDGAEAAASTDGAAEEGDEIVVTAQFRQESSQKAAVSLEVLSADKLVSSGVTQATDIARVSPGVQITQGGSALQIYIRGAGDFSTTSYSNAAVAQNYDGVFASRTQYVANTFFDLERIEVLKGPQGTLYGRNATGGALNIIPVQPKLGETSGYLMGTVQNYDGYSAEGAINLATGEHSALRVSFQGVSRSGYISDGTDDDKHISVRVQFKAEPTDNLTVRLAGNYQHLGGRGHGQVVYQPTAAVLKGATPIVPSDPWTSINDSLNTYISALVAPPGVYHIDTQTVRQDLDVWGVYAHVDWDLGPATLTFIPAYQRVVNSTKSIPTLNFETVDYFTGAPSTSDTQSLELRLANQSDKLTWVLGGYFFNEDQNSNNSVRLGFVSDTNFLAKLNNKGVAAFGQLTYSVTDALRLTGGLRYTHETKSVEADRYAIKGSLGCTSGTGTGPLGSCILPHVSGDYTANKVNYKVGFEFDLGPQNLLFANVASGFKSGGQVNANLPPYLPEDLTAYTIGSKNRFFGNVLQLNAEFFWIDYKNHQENFSTLDRSGAQVQALLNAGSARSKGVSVDVTLRPTRSDTLTVSGEYTDAKYQEFQYKTYKAASPATTTGCPVSAIPGGTAATGLWLVNCNGFQMARTPTWSGSVSYTHSFELANGASIDVGGDMTFSSSRWIEAAFVPNDRTGAYQVYNASITYKSADDGLTIQAFIRNIGDTAVYTGGQQYPFIANYVGRDIGAPRTYGLRVRVGF
ncbi:TonB-dependent receptor [Novosphingobium sp.]|uniref:TonB-dependent receptor n=1 Tax=Novosphingobium sp. TaxID=1874826 RepID=UPI0035B1CCE2